MVGHDQVKWVRLRRSAGGPIDHALAAESGGWFHLACAVMTTGGDLVAAPERKCRACIARLKVANLATDEQKEAFAEQRRKATACGGAA